MTTTATTSGLASPLSASKPRVLTLSATEFEFPVIGSAACPPAARSVRRIKHRLVVRLRLPHADCTANQRFTVVVSINRPALRNSGLRAVDIGVNGRHQTRLTLASSRHRR